MQLRRSTALVLGALLLAVPSLSSCARGYATDRDYTPATGVNNRDADVDVLGAVIVSAEAGSGTFVATFVNNTNDPIDVTSLAGAGIGSTITTSQIDPITVPLRGLVNLADDGGIGVVGDFAAGDFVTVAVTTSDGATTELDVPVVTDDGDYAGLDTATKPENAAS